jgi:hypothetical protein
VLWKATWVKAFHCRICDQPLHFENSACVSCGTRLGYARDERAIVRPNDEDAEGLANYPAAERAKRHLITELDTLGFPVVGKFQDPENGLAESQAAHREKVRERLGEPYRTMLGHFRHEVGHHYEWQLVRGDLLDECREQFGDDSLDYQGEIDRHYAEGPPAGWESSYIFTYATMHPFEDFAETWAHYLHICDTIQTASEYGLATVNSVTRFTHFRDVVVGIWMPLSVALNMINRSMGHEDLYPFVIPDKVLEKLEFVASLSGAE